MKHQSLEILKGVHKISKDQLSALKAICTEVEKYYATIAGIYLDLSSEWLVKPNGLPKRFKKQTNHPILTLGTDRDIPVIIGDIATNSACAKFYKTNKDKHRFFATISLKSKSGIRFARLNMVAEAPRPEFGLNDTDFLREASQRIVKVLKL